MSVITGLSTMLGRVRKAPDWRMDDYVASVFSQSSGPNSPVEDELDTEDFVLPTLDAPADQAAPIKTRLVIYEKPAPDAGVFIKETPAPKKTGPMLGASLIQSELSMLKRKVSAPVLMGGESLTVTDADDPEGADRKVATFAPEGDMNVTVYVPDATGKYRPMTVRLFKDAPLSKVVENAIKQYKLENRIPALSSELPGDYLLRMAEDDGAPDEDFPAPDLTRQASGFGDKFTLVRARIRAASFAVRSNATGAPMSPASERASTGGALTHHVNVYINGVGKALRVPIPAECTVGQAISRTLEAYRIEGRQPLLSGDASVFVMRIAEEDDGSPDTDLPAPERSQQILKFGITYALMPGKPSGRPPVSPSNAQVLLNRGRVESMMSSPSMPTSQAAIIGTPAPGTMHEFGSLATFESLSRRALLDVRSTRGNYFINLRLPTGGSCVLHVAPDLMVKDMLYHWATRRGLNPDHYAVRKPDSEDHVPRESTLVGLDTELVLVPLGSAPVSIPLYDADSTGTGHGSTQDGPLILSEAIAGAYKEYQVVKVNKYGVRQERIMGIDRDQIHNMLRAGDAGFLGSRKVKKQSRPISDIIKLQSGDRPNSVNIEFREGSDRVLMMYECKSKADAQDILARVKFLIDLHKRDSRQ